MSLLMDLQGFQGATGAFIVKELAYVALNSEITTATVKFFQSPIEIRSVPAKYRSINAWLKRNYHGLSWNYGYIPYEEVRDTLHRELKNIDKVYVKGCEKKEWLKDLFYYESKPVFINLEDFFDDCPSISKLKKVVPMHPCPYHCGMENVICAVTNILSLKTWLASKIMHSMDKSICLYYELHSLIHMEPEDIAYLPRSFISTFAASDVHAAWKKLPDEMKADNEISKCHRCLKHHNNSCGCDIFHGLPHMIRDCTGCKEEEKNNTMIDE